MKFKSGARRKAIEYEKDLIQYWKDNDVFQKSIDQRSTDNAYVFYDGPPFITGQPHAGNLISSITKDAVPRYWTMKGKRVERRWGWDCHGLPAEVYTEKKLGLKGKDDVLEYGLEKYICAARDNMVQTGSAWEDTVDRVGRWVEFEGAYKTMDKDYMESVWWAFKELHDKGKIYEGEKVLMYCTQDATPLSKNEVTMDKGAYQDVTDPSVFVKFRLKDAAPEGGAPAYLLAWTTTPWTLLANTAVAVHREAAYVEVRVGADMFILAKNRADAVLRDDKHNLLDYEVVRELKGADLVGMEYEPLFLNKGATAHRVWHADYVATESDSEGTGIVHLAPVYGEEDYELAMEHGFPAVHTIDETGHFTEGPWSGQYVWDINKQIAKDMHRYGTHTLMGAYSDMTTEDRIAYHKTHNQEPDAAIWKIEYIKHSYPHCHRCDTKLMYRAHPSWFMDIRSQKDDMLTNNESIEWFPQHLKHGRFQRTIEQAPDWNISRDRFWATPMPVWEGVDASGVKHQKIVGSYEELTQLSGVELEDYHRPWIDDVTFTIEGVTYSRIDKVLDCWFESGSMPFAQFHYPFENKQKFEDNFPGDFIVEYVGQVRAWFYYMHAVSVGLFGVNSFKNVVVTGNVMGNDGYKLSKSRGNYTDPNEAMDAYSADAYRFVMLSSNLLNGEDYALLDKNISDTHRKLSMVWNMYDFFTMYAEVDDWQAPPDPAACLSDLSNPLDTWIVSRVHQVIAHVDTHMQAYDLPGATRPLLELVDDASNWYVRRSRKRFWKTDDDTDKAQAYCTLYYVLVRMSEVFAPFTPFLSEELHHLLTGKLSVHLSDWPEVSEVNGTVIERMDAVRTAVNEGLSLRSKSQIKVRQPLASITVEGGVDLGSESERSMYLDILKDEVNVKQVNWSVSGTYSVAIDTQITDELRQEGLAREVVRSVQSSRKKAGLDVDDRISLSLYTQDATLQAAINTHASYITAETLAQTLTSDAAVYEYASVVKIEGVELTVALQR